tara:strand:+ start:374 stop:499 length:126 start_codon:yes stop_codon:yes gene_type:complete
MSEAGLIAFQVGEIMPAIEAFIFMFLAFSVGIFIKIKYFNK